MTSKIGRNDPCHCGSGQKYKKCCNSKDDAARSAELAAKAAAAATAATEATEGTEATTREAAPRTAVPPRAKTPPPPPPPARMRRHAV